MGDPSEQQASQSDMDHRLGNVDALFIVAHEPPPACHPAEGSLDDPTTREALEALARVGSLDDLDREIEAGCLVHSLGSIISAVGEQILEPWPALAYGVENEMRALAVRNIGG